MKAKKIKLYTLTSLMVMCLGVGLVSCGNGLRFRDNLNSSLDEWDVENSQVIFERRLWRKVDPKDINVDDKNNSWEYHSVLNRDFIYSRDDGTIRLRNEGDYILSESFNTSSKFSLDITMSLNGGQAFPSGLVLKKGDLALLVEAINGKNKVVDSVLLDDPSNLASEKSMDVIRVPLNVNRKQVSRVRLTLQKAYNVNYNEINIGIGRLKAYFGEQSKTSLKDGVTSDYVSKVKYTDYEAENVDQVQTKGIKLKDYRKNSYDLDSLGNQNILIIPVKFADTDPSKLHVYNSVGKTGQIEINASDLGGFDGIREQIERAYFGEPEETGWESLSSYYYKSSNHKLNITGKVSEWFTYDKTVTEFYEEGNGASSVYALANEACQWYKENFDDYEKFDQNKDGYFDCVEFVYAQPNCNSNKIGVCNTSKYKEAAELFWAFCWKRSGVNAIKNWPTPFTFAWFSYDFLYNNFNTSYFRQDETTKHYTSLMADTHTVVHENGHALGLVDYYGTGYDGASPLAGIDMMDHNIGDHNAYSKWQFQWCEPKEQIVYDENDESTKTYEVTLRPFESSGDFVIIPAYTRDELMAGKDPGKLDSPFNEYISIEYYTPTGLNELDSKEPYQYDKGASTMSDYGIKMLHVDSRLANLSASSTTGDLIFNSYLPVNADVNLLGSGTSSSFTVDLAHRNDSTEQNFDSGDKDSKTNNRLIRALRATGVDETDKNNFKNGDLKNADLFGRFTKGEKSEESNSVMDFGITNHKEFTFNNGFENLYNMEIKSIDENQVTLVFTLKA